MKRSAILILTAAALASLGSCTTTGGDSFVVITRVVQATGAAIVAGSPVQPCTVDSSAPEVLAPAFDPAIGLDIFFAVENRAPTVVTTPRLESNDFLVDQAILSYEVVGGGGTAPADSSAAAQGFVLAGNKSAAFVVQAVAAGKVTAGQTLRVHIYLQGKLLDGTTVRTNNYEFIAAAVTGAGDGSCVRH
jgi:hypothetical protein